MGPAQVQRFLNAWIQGTDMVQYTPGGFAWSSAWGSLRYTANAALIAMVYAGHINGDLHYAHHSSGLRTSQELHCIATSCTASCDSTVLHRILRQHSLGRGLRVILDYLRQRAGCQLCREGGMARMPRP